MSRIACSFRPRLTTAFTLTGQALRRRGVDPVEHARDGEVDVVHRLEGLVVERVEADGDAVEPGRGERCSLRREQRRVRRQRQLGAERREQRDQPVDVLPHERLAARQPELVDAEADEDARHPLDLLEREQLLAVEEAVVAPEDLLRHAVDAAEVAAVGDRDAEVAERPAEAVQGHGRERSDAPLNSPADCQRWFRATRRVS